MTLVSTRYLPKDTEPFEFANGIAYVHGEHICEAEFPCAIHRHSQHVGSDRPMVLTKRGLVGHLDEDRNFHPCPDSVAYYERNYPPQIQYGIRCGSCGDELYSNSRHDFVSCMCESVFIDGGFDYQRVGGHAGTFSSITRTVVPHALPLYYREEAVE